MWSCASTRVPFIELTCTPYLSELDFGWLRIHIKIDWRPKGWDEAEHQAQLNQRLARILESPFPAIFIAEAGRPGLATRTRSHSR
jgi:hypothetical protein